MAAAPPGARKPVALALQGGGAHGAFTWGVLDCLLDDGRIDIRAISGTSAGAINAAVLADGYAKNGRDGARAALESFWQAVSAMGLASPLKRGPLDVLLNNWSLDHSPAYVALDLMSRVVSPYQFNPLNINPLKDLLERTIDFESVHACRDVKLFVAATNVHTGKIRIFHGERLDVDAVMASACLPHLYQAVEIDGAPYWDGGYMGNPPIYPLLYETTLDDVILVQINPVERTETPRTAQEILNRINEISFNSTLLRELRAIDFVTRLIEQGKLDRRDYRQIRMHHIHGDEPLAALSASSKFNAEWCFLTHLRDIGRRMAQGWLERSFDKIGSKASLDLRAMFE